MQLSVDACNVYTGICFSRQQDCRSASTCICFSRGVPTILPYFTNQSFFSGFHRPPAAFACNRIGMSTAWICRGTTVSAVYRGGGGVHSALSTINSIVFSRCRDSASYLKRTQSRASPYFFARLLVPRWPGLRISRVFMQSSGRRSLFQNRQRIAEGRGVRRHEYASDHEPAYHRSSFSARWNFSITHGNRLWAVCRR